MTVINNDNLLPNIRGDFVKRKKLLEEHVLGQISMKL